MHRRCCTTLTLAEKVEVLKRLESNETQQSIAKYFKVSHSQISRIRKNKDLLYQYWFSNVNPETKRQRKSKSDVEPIDGPLFGGLEQDPSMGNRFAEYFPRLLEHYEARNIFGASETSLYSRAMANDNLFDLSKCIYSTRISNSRLTVLLAANMDGSEKLEPMIIGKSKCPHCFRKLDCLPLFYTSDVNASMTKIIWSQWLAYVDATMKAQSRSIVLICDDRDAHNIMFPLHNILTVKLPSSPTSPLQPLHQGVVEAFKQNYQLLLKKRVFENVDSDLERARTNLLSISLLDSLKMQRKAWEQITPFQINISFSASSLYEFFIANKQSNMPVDKEREDSNEPIDLSCPSKIPTDENRTTCTKSF